MTTFLPVSAWRDLDDLRETFLRPGAGLDFTKDHELTETQDHYFLSLDIPGVKKEDLKVEVNDKELSISGNRRSPQTKIERRFTLPQIVDAEKIEATLEDGVLHVAMPKAESAKPRNIEIRSGSNGLWSKLLETEKSTEKAH